MKTQKKRKKTGPKTLQSEVERFQDEAKKAHLERLREELDGDDKEIKFLMKKLGYNKRKTTAMPQIFEKEGLHRRLLSPTLIIALFFSVVGFVRR